MKILGKTVRLPAGLRGYCVPKQLEWRIVSLYGNKCYMCGGDWEAIDHVIPKSDGGTNDPVNLRPICQPCNSKKKDKRLAQMMKSPFVRKPRSHNYGNGNCPVCLSEFIMYKRTQKTCSRQCAGKLIYREGRSSIKPALNKGGYITKQGYKMVRCPGHIMADKKGYCLEHRLVMSNHLGRKLLRTEVVDHRFGNKLDNRIEKLRLYDTSSAHSKHGQNAGRKVKGWPHPGHSEETKKKISEAHKGFQYTSQARRKMSISRKAYQEEKVCEVCGKRFKMGSTTGLYCSKSCSNAERNAARRKGAYDRECPVCHTMFNTNLKQTYCSKDCKCRADNAKRNEKRRKEVGFQLITSHCEVCGQPYEHNINRPKKTCSKRCAFKAWYIKQK